MNDITVVIPVGHKPAYKNWLPEAVESVLKQTVLPREIFIVDDQANISISDFHRLFREPGYGSDFYHAGYYNKVWFGRNEKQDRRVDNLGEVYSISRCGGEYFKHEENSHRFRATYWRTPWRLGFSASFNCGVGLAENDLIVFLASDDIMMPNCIEACIESYKNNDQKDAWYYMTYEVENDGIFNLPNNVALITKGLWAYLGGFPPSAFAGPDALLISILLKHSPDKLVHVKSDGPLQWLRQHKDQDTHEQASHFNSEVISIRNKETNRFIPNPEWAKHFNFPAWGISGYRKRVK